MSQIVKQKIILIALSIVLLFSFFGFLCTSHSLAWFAANRRVEANGVSVSAKVSPNLVIYKSADEIDDEDKAFQFSVDFEGTSRENMVAVTRDKDTGEYKYLVNTHAVGHESGLAKDPEVPLVYETVPATKNDAYFIDYTVYIASAGVALNASSLTATIDPPEIPPPSEEEAADEEFDLEEYLAGYLFYNAASIDFYVGTADADGYRGTASVANAATSVELLEKDTEIPLNTEGGYITVIMRCYFDGALTYEETVDGKTVTRAYINSYTVTPNTHVVFGVDFVATDAPTTTN
ncbi:MAG: hypothetical protein J6T24_08780 [Clostridia bacterium]|nr:hypothetical protein [Clostridia bacterium]